jgi:hypothetical protein
MVFRLVLSPEERKAIEELEKVDDGFVQSFRNIIRQLVNIFDHSHSESQVKLRLKQLRTDIEAAEDKHLDKILQFLDDHWDQAFAYLRKRGMGKHRRGSNSESGMRLIRRLEKNQGIPVKRDISCHQSLSAIADWRLRARGNSSMWDNTVSNRSGNSRRKNREAGVDPSEARQSKLCRALHTL